MLMDTVRDIERIGDHFENIIELIDYRDVNRINLTEDAMDRFVGNVRTNY